MPEINKKAQAFFKKNIGIQVETIDAQEQNAKKQRPSEVRAQVMKSPVVKEVMAEFNGMVKDVKPNE